jgi:hypothetical protein
VKKGNDKLYVECKRLAKVTQYSENERNVEWLKDGIKLTLHNFLPNPFLM